MLKAKEFLNDDGVLVIEEPNDNSPLQHILEPKYGKYWLTPDHVNYFTYSTLERGLNELGFEVVHKSATYPMELFEISGRPYIGDDEKGKALHKEVTLLLKNLGLRNRKMLLDGFANLGLGRDLILYCKKGVLR